MQLEPELRPLLTNEQVGEARNFALPVTTVGRGTNVIGTLKDSDAFSAIMLDGLLLHGMQIGKRPALRLVEPGDVVPFTRGTSAIPLGAFSLRAVTRSRIALLDGHFLAATQRWPQLTALIHRRAVQSSERLATQLAISHLPRVEDRLMALMWLLAETWGHVTPSGIRVRLVLTHDALGELIGAQRPTVTLALKELAERGSLIRQDEDWLILDPPPEPQAVELEAAGLVDVPPRGPAWGAPAEREPHKDRLSQLRSELACLRQQHARDRARGHDLADEARRLRTRTHELVFDAHLLADVTHDGRDHDPPPGDTTPRFSPVQARSGSEPHKTDEGGPAKR